MRNLRIFITISILLLTAKAFACFTPPPASLDNMIYRLYEDVSPYYHFYDTGARTYLRSNETFDNHAENLRLWRQQTGTSISDDSLNWYVYKSSLSELYRQKTKAIKEFGNEGFNVLVLAKKCENVRYKMDDPWYYPYKGDTLVLQLRDITKAASYRGKFINRYALQTIRAFVALQKFKEAVRYWETVKSLMKRDLVYSLAERHVASAYLNTGDVKAASAIYVKCGDIVSLKKCGLKESEIWNTIFKYTPNSPFFKEELQCLLTHLDNNMIRNQMAEGYYYESYNKDERERIACVLNLADYAIKDKRVCDHAMWYYAKATILDAINKPKAALPYVYAGEKVCHNGTFMATTMRVLRIYLEAQTSRYDSTYKAKLANDLIWLDNQGKQHITPSIKKSLARHKVTETWGGECYSYFPDIVYENKYFWSDVMRRILAGTLAPRLKAEGKPVDALLYANLGEFWLIKQAYGKADCPNDCGFWSKTNHTNGMAEMADTCSANDIIRLYKRLSNPSGTIEHLVAANGISSKDYWHDFIGTRLISEHRYAEAAKWLKGISHSFQKKQLTWDYYDQDPFCMKIGYFSGNRKHDKNRYDYKLRFARDMAKLQRQMKHGRSADIRGKAMIMYGVGLRNQSDWCWSLERFSDFLYEHDDYVDNKNSKKWIDKGIATLHNRELKAYYLHVFVRNKEVMDLLSDTKTAQNLRSHCDLWRDYKKN